jgi:hypothetical protein
MTDAGNPSLPDDSSCRLEHVQVDVARPIGPVLTNADTAGQAIPTEVVGRKTRRDRLPFVVQSGTTLYVVAEEATAWVLAELEFDSQSCQFSIEKQSQYQWPREALGRLLSRVMVNGNVNSEEAERLCSGFGEWMAAQFVH